MPETTHNDAPGVDRPTSRADQEGPGKAGGAARPPGEIEAEHKAREAAVQATAQRTKTGGSEEGSPTDTAP
jgi:hypothetical protein